MRFYLASWVVVGKGIVGEMNAMSLDIGIISRPNGVSGGRV